MAQPHAVHSAVNLHCKKCHKGRCFVHLAEMGIHSAEAITSYKKSLDQGPWHNLHQSRKNTFTSDKERVLAAETSGDSFSNLMGQKLAIIALSFPHCQPFNLRHIKFGWYDRLKSSGMAVRAIRLIRPIHRYCLTHNHQGPRFFRRHGYVIPSRWG
jgi:hypothetical protein